MTVEEIGGLMLFLKQTQNYSDDSFEYRNLDKYVRILELEIQEKQGTRFSILLEPGKVPISLSESSGEFESRDLSIRELQNYCTVRNREFDPGGLVTLEGRGNELAGEVGEACNVIKKLERARMGLPATKPATLDMLRYETADVVICAILVAMQAGFDLTEAVIEKFNVSSEEKGLTIFIPDGKTVPKTSQG